MVGPSRVDILTRHPAESHPQVLIIARPPAGKALGIHIFLLTPDIGWTELKGVQPLHIIGLADRRAVLILSSVVDVDPEQNRRITHWQRTALADAPDKLALRT